MPTKKRFIRRQAVIPGLKRIPSSTSLMPKVRAWVERESARFGVAKSFVVAACIAEVAGIDHEEYTK